MEDGPNSTEQRLFAVERSVKDLEKKRLRLQESVDWLQRLLPVSLLAVAFSVVVLLLPAVTWVINDERMESGWSMGGDNDPLNLLTGGFPTIAGILGLVAALTRTRPWWIATSVAAAGTMVALLASPLHQDSDNYPSYSDWDQTGALPVLYFALLALTAVALSGASLSRGDTRT